MIRRIAEHRTPRRRRLNHRIERSLFPRLATVVPASCPVCRCLVLPVRELPDGTTTSQGLWDPTWAMRRYVRWYFGSLVCKQEWGIIQGGWHECPPVGD